MFADFRSLGLSDEKVGAITTAGRKETCEVWRSNETSLAGFLAVETQWRAVATFGGLIWTGLDYTAVRAVNLTGTSKRARRAFKHLVSDLREMELAALPVLNGGDG